MARTEKPPIEERIASRWFGDREVIEALDAMTTEGVMNALRTVYDDALPSRETTYSAGSGLWSWDDPRPALASDDPAVMQAIGRCAAWQVRRRMPALIPSLVKAHPTPCAWCEYPAAELLLACDWSVLQSRHVASEVLTWKGTNETIYRRSGRDDVHLALGYADFWAMPPAAREVRVHRAMYPEAVQSSERGDG